MSCEDFLYFESKSINLDPERRFWHQILTFNPPYLTPPPPILLNWDFQIVPAVPLSCKDEGGQDCTVLSSPTAQRAYSQRGCAAAGGWSQPPKSSGGPPGLFR